MRIRPTVVLLAVALLVCGVGPAAGSVASDGDATDPALVVHDDGDAEYASIQAALDDAGDGDAVRVRPGTYREQVVVDANVTLVAPRGATLDGTGLGNGTTGIEIAREAAPVIEGFTVVGYEKGVAAVGTTGDWQLRNLTIRADYEGVDVPVSTGDWEIHDVTIRGAYRGIDATKSDGDWTIRNGTVRGADQYGVSAASATGAWSIQDTTVIDTVRIAVDALNASGPWTVSNATVRNATVGVSAYRASDAWTVRDSTIANVTESARYDFLKPPVPEGTAIYAAETTGAWTVRGTAVASVDTAIVATDADPQGDATENSWGDADSDACVGNVDCGLSLTTATTVATSGFPIKTTTSGNGTTESPASAGEGQPLSPALAVVAFLIAAGLVALRARSSG